MKLRIPKIEFQRNKKSNKDELEEDIYEVDDEYEEDVNKNKQDGDKEDDIVSNKLINIKKILIIGTLVLLCVSLILVVVQNIQKSNNLSLSSNRAFNKSNIEVVDGSDVYEIKQNNILKNGSPLIRVGDYKKNILSKIDGYLFFQDKEGLVKYDIDNDMVNTLYYDAADYMAVGLNNVYYIADGFLYKLDPEGLHSQVEKLVSDKLAFTNDSYLYFFTSNEVKAVNLNTDEIIAVDTIEHALTDYSTLNSSAAAEMFIVAYEDKEPKFINYIEKENE